MPGLPSIISNYRPAGASYCLFTGKPNIKLGSHLPGVDLSIEIETCEKNSFDFLQGMIGYHPLLGVIRRGSYAPQSPPRSVNKKPERV